MRLLLRLAGFRAALAYTALLLLASGVVLGLLYGRLAENMRTTQDNLIWREAAALSFIHQRDGVRALAQAVSADERGQGSYLRLSDGLGAYLAGNLKDFPTDAQTGDEGWLGFDSDNRPVRARLLQLDADLVLLVGHDVSDGASLLATFRQAFILALFAMLLVGLGGGVFLARRGLKRVEAIGTGLAPVMAGDLTARLPASNSGAEWQALETQINAMLAQLEKLMQATRQVSDNLAHDLRAPLTRLRARLDALLAKSDTDELAGALDDVDVLLRSFNSLLTLSRLDSGVAKLNAEPLNVSTLLTDMHDLFAPLYDEQNMRLALSVDDGLKHVGNAGLLGQALVNLLENALAHGVKADSTAELSAVQNGDKLILSLADSGVGIAPDKRDVAVERFIQLDDSRSGGGSGLGLSLVAAICDHHGGALVLADNDPGLRVEMHLPASV
ncbi:MAG: HAMP domain-containing histidine kinase [Alphaproteobacteria bacterium]|nr:HAMP domain-containing histidine kinase [Alphaproteobacteria bacterium]